MHALFSRCGAVRRIVVGLDRDRHTPCGFAFVEYETRSSAEACVRYLNGTTLDDREIRIDFDWGFVEGREFGRGKSGGQVRDEYRTYYDAGRGGYGKLLRDELEEMRASGGGEGGAGRAPRARRRWARNARARERRDERERERERERVVNTNCLFCTRAREATRFARSFVVVVESPALECIVSTSQDSRGRDSRRLSGGSKRRPRRSRRTRRRPRPRASRRSRASVVARASRDDRARAETREGRGAASTVD